MSVGDFVIIKDTNTGEISQIGLVSSTNPSVSTTTTTSTTQQSTTTTTSSTTGVTNTEENKDQNEGTAPSGNYPNGDTAEDSTVGYTVIDLASGNALLTQTLSLDSLLETLGNTFNNYSILSGSEVSLRVSLSDLDASEGITGTVVPNSIYTIDDSTVSH